MPENTEKKKALLVVAGGRIAPDILPLFYLEPRVVVVLKSREGWHAQQAFIDAAKSIPNCKVRIIPDVDAYNLEAGIQACRDACKPYPDTEWDWFFTIGSAPKITGIAAYEVAKEKGVPCWHIDTRHEQVISLVKPVKPFPIDTQRFFHLSVSDYMKIQKRKCETREGITLDYRQKAEALAPITRLLVDSPDTQTLLLALRDKKEGDIVKIPEKTKGSIELLSSLEAYGLLKIISTTTQDASVQILTHEASRLLGTGEWLELYVWHAAKQAKFADDCEWGYRIFAGKVENELDLALTYKAQLLIAECKTDTKPFLGDNRYLGQLDALAHLLGGDYVSKIFVTNQPAIGDSYKIFQAHATQRKIVVVTREGLPNIGETLKNEAMSPTYERK